MARNRTVVGGPLPADCGLRLCTFLMERWDVKARAGGRGRVQTLLLTSAEPAQSPPPPPCVSSHVQALALRGLRHQTGHWRRGQYSPSLSASVCVAGTAHMEFNPGNNPAGWVILPFFR